MPISFRPYDIGCEPVASGAAELWIQNDLDGYLVFLACSNTTDGGGSKDLGVAVLKYAELWGSRFGYPNEHGINEHPYFDSGLFDSETSVLEILESPWAGELSRQAAGARERLWSAESVAAHAKSPAVMRHFVIVFRGSLFECVANSLEVVQFFTSFERAIQCVFKTIDDREGGGSHRFGVEERPYG